MIDIKAILLQGEHGGDTDYDRLAVYEQAKRDDYGLVQLAKLQRAIRVSKLARARSKPFIVKKSFYESTPK